MKKLFYLTMAGLGAIAATAQSPGDTIIIPTIDYTYPNRSAYVEFPDVPVEKILMLYNMRCKDGLVSPPQQGQTNIGCGEWDYTCNTYVTDSSQTDSTKGQHPSHIITGFNGTTYNYSNDPTYTYYQYTQQVVTNTTTISEAAYMVGSGSQSSNAPFGTAGRTSKSQFLWTAGELAAAGLTAGNITSIRINVTNAGTAPQFLKVKMKTTNVTALDDAAPDMAGFTEVYFLNTALVNGMNQLDFYNSFNWNGTDNILIEFSFTNPSTGTNSVVTADNTSNISGLVSSGDDYAYDFTGNNMMSLGGDFSNFNDQISIGFWCYGDPGINGNSIVYSTNAQGHRLANIHMPWDLQVFWDCGVGGAYDRIFQAAQPEEYSEKWNYWVFTKNATTGSMQAYLNGSLWKSGSNNNMNVVIDQLLLGSMPNNENAYRGKFDEFTLWNTELSAATIQAWMNKSITSAHPNFSNLLAYYRFDENGGTVTDANIAANTGTVTGNGAPQWRLNYGKDIFKNFAETTTRPTITFVRGLYTQTTAPVIITDSIQNDVNTVYAYAVTGTDITLINTQDYFQAGYSYVYDGDSGELIDSVNNPSDGTINITQLDYYRKSPSSFQLVSFVTPYGINLDMGMNGKTWTLDVTDFAPVLKGWKRIFMNGGGEYQEQMDIKFAFIVGTPPRDVKDIRNIWKVESVGYTNLLSDAKMEPRSLTLDPGADAFKIKTAITGHGQEGEFIPRTHYINVNGGSNEFSWEVWKECALNPVYPQGGTWVYDRAGWCPGMATDVEESVLTNAPGDNVTIDYGINTASGSSNYWISNQLITYGAPNFELDAAIQDVKNPSNKIEYARENPICNSPVVTIKNTGSTTLTNATIEYWVNSSATKESFEWNGSLPFLATADVTLPVGNLWETLNATGSNTFHAEIKSPNGGSDEYAHNNKFRSPFVLPEIVPSDFILWVKTNNRASETSYKLLDEDDNVLLDRSSLSNNTDYRDTLHLGYACYKLIVSDSDDDGISFWANQDENDGFVRIRKIDGSTHKNFEGDFGQSIIYNFTTNWSLNLQQLENENKVRLYPNPTNGFFALEGKMVAQSEIIVYNQIGQIIALPVIRNGQSLQVDGTTLPAGIYNIRVKSKDGYSQSLKLTKVN